MKNLFPLVICLFLVSLSLYAQDNPFDIYSKDVDKIIQTALADEEGFERFGYLCDTFGPRLAGSTNLEQAIDWCFKTMLRDQLDNIQMDPVDIPNWQRGTESARLIYPRHHHVEMLGLGGSISTPEGGVIGEVYVVGSYDELLKNPQKAKDKIVLFNVPFTNYGETVRYRFNGAVWAAEAGAIASIVRSVSPIGMKNAHTGLMGYKDGVKKIPHCAITLEDAEYLQRLQNKGIKPVIHIKMSAQTLPDAPSFNLMGQITGTQKPEEIISIGGHIDSWDVGTGAHDDAGGVLATWHAVKLLKDLGLKTKRTLRVVLWTSEENGMAGGKAYAEMHKHENHYLAFEMDGGVFEPIGIRINSSEEMFNQAKNAEKFLKRISDRQTIEKGGGGADISPLQAMGVPVSSIAVDDEGHYFWYHHTHSDTFDKIDKDVFRKCVATIAVSMYLIANM